MDKEKRMLHAILDTVDDGIYVISQDYTVEFMNSENGRHVRRWCG